MEQNSTITEYRILSTTDYSIFKTVTSNRKLVEKHVKSLMEAIKKKNLLHLVPIIVNSDFYIFDGQHRLGAAERLGIPIFFMVDPNITKEDIATLNSNKRNWNTNDYVDYYTLEGYDSYTKLTKFLKDYPKLRVNTALILLSTFPGRTHEKVKTGTIDVGNHKHALIMAEICSDFFNHFSNAYDRVFLQTIRRVYEDKIYKHEHMKKKLEKYGYTLKKCDTVKAYKDKLEYIYNVDEQHFTKLFIDHRSMRELN